MWRSRIKSNIQNTKGSITVYLLVIIVIIGSIMLTNGIFPTVEPIDTGEEPRQVVIDDEAPPASDASKNALRLRTIEFKPCTETAAVTLQLDITGSMRPSINDLKNAVYAFTDQLSDDSVIGIQAYNQLNPRREVIPVALYDEVKNRIRPQVGGLFATGGTPTYEALQFSEEILQSATSQFPERTFSYIFFSDGNPNLGPREPEAIGAAAAQIKNLGVTIYAIGLGDINREIIEVIASSPETAFYTTNSKDLENIYSQISTELCGNEENESPPQE